MNQLNDEVFFDIETVPTQQERLRDIIYAGVKEKARAESEAVRAPSNYKDEAKIAAYIEAAQAEIVEAAAAKQMSELHSTSLDGAYGEVYCFGFAVNDGATQLISRGTDLSPMSERRALRDFFTDATLLLERRTRPILIGHNIVGFDIRFIYQRAMVLGVQPPSWLYVDAKPWDEVVFDTMVKWAGVRDRVSLTKLCHAFDIDDTDTISGRDVWACIQRGEHAKVEEHCRIDIDKVRRIYQRMTFAG